MKTFCAVKFRYYKHTNSSGEIGHVIRYGNNRDKNILPKQFIKYKNFGNFDLIDRYKNAFQRAESQKGRKIQKNSNTYVDAVVILSSDKVDEIIEKHGFNKFKNAVDRLMVNWQESVKEEFGFEPCGYVMHNDEGHIDQSTGKVNYNYHIHGIFFNYDFLKGSAPLRKLSRSSFSRQQDLLYREFKKIGFIRGTPKSQTKNKGLVKDEYLAQKRKSLENKLETTSDLIINLEKKANRFN
jgi:hypothetical protein